MLDCILLFTGLRDKFVSHHPLRVSNQFLFLSVITHILDWFQIITVIFIEAEIPHCTFCQQESFQVGTRMSFLVVWNDKMFQDHSVCLLLQTWNQPVL